MAEINEVYKCNICGNVVEAVHGGAGEVSCCGSLMELKQIKTEDDGFEKHKPVIEKTGNAVIVRVGSVNHPMTSEHYIEWIEVVTEHRVYRKFLTPEMEPTAEFLLEAEHITARAYCNLHGLWIG